MLREALRLMAGGEVRSVPELAQRLGVSTAMVEELMAQLLRLGYLKGVSSACTAGCGGCPMATACEAQATLWKVTNAGMRAARAA